MTIENQCNLTGQLILDLRRIGQDGVEVDGVDGLDIEYVKQPGEKETMMISLNKHPTQQEIDKKMKEAQFILNKNKDDHDLSYVSDEEQIDVEAESRIKQITIYGNTTLHFKLSYKPFKTKNFNFKLPIILKGYGSFEGINREVSCKGGKKPEFVVKPNQIVFKKQIISYSS